MQEEIDHSPGSSRTGAESFSLGKFLKRCVPSCVESSRTSVGVQRKKVTGSRFVVSFSLCWLYGNARMSTTITAVRWWDRIGNPRTRGSPIVGEKSIHIVEAC